MESSGDALNTSRWLFNKYLNLSNPETKLVLELNWTQINEISINYAYMFIWSQDHLVNPVHLSLDFHFPYTDTPMPIFFLKILCQCGKETIAFQFVQIAKYYKVGKCAVPAISCYMLRGELPIALSYNLLMGNWCICLNLIKAQSVKQTLSTWQP